MVKLKKTLFPILLILSMVSVVLTQTSCETLQKKFTRKKKENKKNEIIPILEPVDYAAEAVNPQKQYTFHYSIWKVWQKDLLKAIQDNDSEKRLHYLLKQNIAQLQEMRKFAAESQQMVFDEIISKYEGLKTRLSLTQVMRNDHVLSMDIERLGKRVKHELGVKVIFPELTLEPESD